MVVISLSPCTLHYSLYKHTTCSKLNLLFPLVEIQNETKNSTIVSTPIENLWELAKISFLDDSKLRGGGGCPL